MTQLCKGQATRRPCMMPCDNGPPLWGHRSRRANTSSAWVRNKAMLPNAVSRTLAPWAGMSLIFPICCQSFTDVCPLYYSVYSGSPAPVLVVIHKSSQARKAVISAGMPKSRPWTVTRRLCKCLIQATCQALVSRQWIQGHLLCSTVCHP